MNWKHRKQDGEPEQRAETYYVLGYDTQYSRPLLVRVDPVNDGPAACEPYTIEARDEDYEHFPFEYWAELPAAPGTESKAGPRTLPMAATPRALHQMAAIIAEGNRKAIEKLEGIKDDLEIDGDPGAQDIGHAIAVLEFDLAEMDRKYGRCPQWGVVCDGKSCNEDPETGCEREGE